MKNVRNKTNETELVRRIKSSEFSTLPNDVQNRLLEDLKQESRKKDAKSKRICRIILALIGTITLVTVIFLIFNYKNDISDIAISIIVIATVVICILAITGKADGIAEIIKHMRIS